MSYATYTTEALVCGASDRNSNDRSYRLFTERFGMLYATARSVRFERSRQRYALSEFSYLRVTLLQGKSGWRITSITPDYNPYYDAAGKLARGSVVRVVRLLRRVVTGEEPVPQLYEYVRTALGTLATSIPERITAEQYVLVTILSELGYVRVSAIPESLRLGKLDSFTPNDTEQYANTLRTLIDRAEIASQL
jgi:recombinational DNA repair protein (RecF pathway)